MSALYNLDPPPTAKVLLHTSHGTLPLELFCTQAPKTSRNFLQLCLDSYYDDTIFHRLVPGFIIQGGDPTGTGHGGEAIYPGGIFEDEFHSRLKYNRRGMLGMANGGAKNDNGSQFFLTLAEARELEGKNTLFGRVAMEGAGIYELMKWAEGEIGADERPLYPVKVLSTEVLVNPFDDLIRTERRIATARPSVDPEARKRKVQKKKKPVKTLLSFGVDDGGDEDIQPVAKKAKFNPNLVSGEVDTVVHEGSIPSTGPSKPSKPSQPRSSTRKPKRSSISRSPPAVTIPTVIMANEATKTTTTSKTRPSSPSLSPSPSLSTPLNQSTSSQSTLARTNLEIAALKASMKRPSTHHVSSTKAAPYKAALEAMIPPTSTRGGRKRKPNANSDREALAILSAFKAKLSSAAADDKSISSTQLKQPSTDSKSTQPSHSSLTNSPNTDLPSTSSTSNKNNTSKITTQDQDLDEDSTLCDLHFISHCASCQAWDPPTLSSRLTCSTLKSTTNPQRTSPVPHPSIPTTCKSNHPTTTTTNAENNVNTTNDPKNDNEKEDDETEPDDNSKDWMTHTLTFAKDRLGKDLTWKRQTAESVVVMDPLEMMKGVSKPGMREVDRGGSKSTGMVPRK